MKRNLAILLCLVLLTGCGAAPESSTEETIPAEDTVSLETDTEVETETRIRMKAETTVTAETQLLTETIVSAETAIAQPEAPATPSVETQPSIIEETYVDVLEPQPEEEVPEPEEPAPAADSSAAGTDAESLYQAYIRETLIPQYGISDMQSYENLDWTNGDVKSTPSGTQGLTSALVQDFTGDGVPELVTVRALENSWNIEAYCIRNDTVQAAGSYTVCIYEEGWSRVPVIYTVGNMLFVKYSVMSVPGTSSWGDNIRVLQVTDGDLKEVCSAGTMRFPAGLYLLVNSEQQQWNELELGIFESTADVEIMTALVQAGVPVGMISCSYGYIELEISGQQEIFCVQSQNYAIQFKDSTGFREKFS